MVTALRKMLTLILSGLVVAISAASSAVEVTISVDKNPVTSGSRLTLSVIADDHLSRTAWQAEQQLPQFSVLSTAVNSSTQISNGRTSRSTEFRTELQAPTKPGRYRIGPLQVAGATTNAIDLTVLPLSAAEQAQQAPAAFMEVTLDRQQLYVQQQLQLTATLYLSANLLSGNIVPPQLQHAEISQLGKDQESYEMRNGKRYQVFKRVYLITPQRSGDLTISAPVFSGQINSGRSLSPFTAMNSTETVTTAAQQLPIKVLPVPAEWPASASWLPAELATISVEADNSNNTGQVGEPLTITYRITAIGVQSDLLPALQLAAIATADSYPEPSQRQTSERNGKLIAQQVTQVAIIPRQSGTLVIPPQQLIWFNTITGQVERSISPALEFDIAAASALQPQSAINQSAVVTASATSNPTVPLAASQSNWWPYLLLLVVLLWASTSAWLLLQLRQLRQAQQNTAEPMPRFDLKQLRQACHNNAAEQAELALKHWASQQLGLQAPLLSALAAHFNNAPLTAQLEHLNHCRYAAQSPPWQEGKALWRAVQALQRQQPQSAETEQLPALYPPP